MDFEHSFFHVHIRYTRHVQLPVPEQDSGLLLAVLGRSTKIISGSVHVRVQPPNHLHKT